MGKSNPVWFSTPHFAPDYRGPTDLSYAAFPKDGLTQSFATLLERAAHRDGDRTAVHAGDHAKSIESLVAEIASGAAQIGACVPEGQPVGVLTQGGPTDVSLVFAALVSGRVSLLLDAAAPSERNAQIARVAGVKQMICAASEGAGFFDTAHPITLSSQSGERRLPNWSEDINAPAVVLCTSGSTGEPAPIAHSQATLMHWVRTLWTAMHLGPQDRALSLSSVASLGGITSLLTFPLVGASLEILDLRRQGLAGLLQVLLHEPVTVLRAAPSMLRLLPSLPDAAFCLKGLRVLQTYGEPLLMADVRSLRAVLSPSCLVRSTYGATECSGFSWYAREEDDYDATRAPAGCLMPDTEAAVINAAGENCGPGEEGELLIRSRYNALGDWSGGQISDGRLRRDPGAPELRIYETGDLCRRGEDGVFVVLGRNDRMVKVNGQRVEPSEIETAIRRQAEVDDAAVVVRTEGKSVLVVAFVVWRTPSDGGDHRSLRATLRTLLPRYMQPQAYHSIDHLPRAPSGKVSASELWALHVQNTEASLSGRPLSLDRTS